jgi:hypothetical protein
MSGEVGSSRIAPWENPVRTVFESKPGAHDGVYPGRVIEDIHEATDDSRFVLQGEGAKETRQTLQLLDHQVQNPRKTIIDELGSAHAAIGTARDHIQGLRDIMTSTGLSKFHSSFGEFETWVARNGQIDALNGLAELRRSVAGAWDWKNPGAKGNDIPRFNADGSVYEEDRAHLGETRKSVKVPTDLTPKEELNFPAKHQLVLKQTGDARVLETDARRFHVTPEGQLKESLIWRLDNVIARMPKDALGSLTEQEMDQVLQVRNKEIKDFLDAIQWNDGRASGGTPTPPDLDRAEASLNKLEQMLKLPESALPGTTIAEANAQRAEKAATEAEHAATMAERAVVGKKWTVGIVAGAGVALAGLGAGIASLMGGDDK